MSGLGCDPNSIFVPNNIMVFYRISIDWTPRGVCRRVGGLPAGQGFSEKLTIRSLVFTENFGLLAVVLAAMRPFMVPHKDCSPFLNRKLINALIQTVDGHHLMDRATLKKGGRS